MGPHATGSTIALLLEDRELALGIPAPERAAAERVVLVPRLSGATTTVALDGIPEPTLGVLVLDGFLGATTQFADQSTMQVLGPGSLVQQTSRTESALPVVRSHGALTPVRLAILDRRFIAAVRRWPGLLLALHERMRAQQQQLAVYSAIGQLPRGEDRVLAMLWQLAEQWGKVTAEGIVLPLSLPHALLGRLIGASRPTTSLALTALEAAGTAWRGPDGLIVLRHDGVDGLGAAGTRKYRSQHADVHPAGATREALLARVAALHDAEV